ncbi:hypothetical protein Pmani_000938 [Petrolisthes manimaculis]|uniref:Uncharacterized protein n=1 Tax=Petrolisthes manimaculis TaxID=1843537 RepID=A0AAE1QKL4_9EUCA|nr:hypothetical protein Pmani_000938 [Petrolisthes manimaculis]
MEEEKQQFQLQGEAARSPYSSQSRGMVLQVYQYLRMRSPLMCEADLEAETAAATGISVRTLQRIKKEDIEGRVISPSAKRKRNAPVLDSIDSFDENCIRNEITAFYERREIPTHCKILEKVKEPPVNIYGGRTSLQKLFHKIGFHFKVTDSGRHILMERDDIVAARCKYLRVLNETRNSTNPPSEVYLDETWVNQNESVKKCWTTSEGKVGPKLKSGKGARFIILHAGGANGFVPGGWLLFKSKNGNKGDYHDSMNSERFHEWFQNQLLPGIPPGSLIIMNNAPYHSKILNKAPNMS